MNNIFTHNELKLDVLSRVETERLVLQALRYEDAEEIFYVYASKPQSTRFVSWPMHETIEDTRRFLEYAIHGRTLGNDYSFAIRTKANNRFIGTFGILNTNPRIQFGYVLGPIHWGHGYATEVCTRMMKLLRQLTDRPIGTFVDSENIASARVLIKSGLVEEARLPLHIEFVNQGGAVKDCVLYRLP
jgi:[ribosomal protein S5]-alanine N-acetyltransferase